MMRLPRFEYHAPRDVDEAVRLLAEEGPRAMILAGGTDLLPNMKRRHQCPEVLVSLRQIASLRGTHEADGGYGLGAATTLTELSYDPTVATHYAALRQAAAQVATPHLRNSATIGGNICLDTRCTYYDQNAEWREAIDYSMKAEGETCWVAPGSPKCLAVSSTDCAPALIALDAEIELSSAAETRRLAMSELYKNDGIFYIKRRRDELLTSVQLPERKGWTSSYWKLRRRGSIDFPVLGVAAALKLEGETVEDARVVLGAVASRPLLVENVNELLRGEKLSDELIEEAAGLAAKLAKPMDHSDFTLHWRKAVVKPYVAGILRQLRGDDPAEFSLLARRAATAVAPPS